MTKDNSIHLGATTPQSKSTNTPQTSQFETIEMATTSLFWLLAIFTAIKKASKEHSEVHELARVGEHLAQDQGNTIDCLREQFQAMEGSL